MGRTVGARWILVATAALVATIGVVAAVFVRDEVDDPVAADVERAAPRVGEASDVLDVACRADGIQLTTPLVAAQADGIHVVVRALPDDGTSVEISEPRPAEPGRPAGFGGAHQVGETVVDTVGPGSVLVRCYPNGGPRHFMDAAEDPESVEVEISDPEGQWQDVGGLECNTDAAATEIIDYASRPEPARNGPSLEEFVADDSSLRRRPGDVIEIGGYTWSDAQWVQVVRDGRVVTIATYSRDGDSWRRSGSTSCAE